MNSYAESVLTEKLESEKHKAESIANDVKNAYKNLIGYMRYLSEHYDNITALCNSLNADNTDFDNKIREILGEDAYYMFATGKYNRRKTEWQIVKE